MTPLERPPKRNLRRELWWWLLFPSTTLPWAVLAVVAICKSSPNHQPNGK